MTCADTSFLLSLSGKDGHTAKARAWMLKHKQPLTLHSLNRVEFVNAIHLSVFRKVRTSAEADAILRAHTMDFRAGRLLLRQLALEDVTAEAVRLSHKHTRTSGYRTFDILHVAAARLMECKTFLSFDDHHRVLAAVEGMKTAP